MKKYLFFTILLSVLILAGIGCKKPQSIEVDNVNIESPAIAGPAMKANKANIVKSQNRGNGVVKYYYKDEVLLELPNEIVALRKPNARIFNTGQELDGKSVLNADVISANKYYEINNEWVKIESATTTEEIFNLAMKDTWIERLAGLFIKAAKADDFNPDADPESSSVDGTVGDTDAGNATWSDAINGPGTESDDSSTTAGLASYYSGSSYESKRVVTTYDISSIGEINVVSAHVSSTPVNLADADGEYMNVFETSPAATTTLSSGDFAIARWGSTKFASDLSLSALSDDTEFRMDLNASAITYIDGVSAGSGLVRIGYRMGRDIDATSPTGLNRANIYTAESANDPVLSITYTAAATPVAPQPPALPSYIFNN